MSHFLHRLSIRNKLMLAMLVASFSTLALVITVVMVWDKKDLENAVLENSAAISQSLTQTFLKMQLLDSPESVADTVTVLRSFKAIKQAYLYNEKDLAIFQYHKTGEPVSNPPDIALYPEVTIENDFLHIVRPLTFSGKEYGKVYFKIDKEFLAKWQDSQNKRILLFTIFVSILAYFYAKFVAPFIARPITDLALSMSSVVKNKDLSLRVQTEEKREILQLYNGFNQMLAAIDKYSKELQNHKYAIDQAAIVSVTDVMGRITYVNDYFTEVSGYKQEELLGQYHRIVKSELHSDSYFKNLWETIASGKVWKGEICNRTKDGSYYWVDTTIVPFLNEVGKPYQYMAIRYLITEKKRVQSELAKINANQEKIIKKRTDELEASNQLLMQSEKMASLGELVAGVAHEINTPIGIGVTAASNLKENVVEIKQLIKENKITKRHLNEFIEEAEETSDIILKNLDKAAVQIRSFKEVAVDQTSEEKRIFNVAEYLDEIFMSLRPKLKNTGYQVNIECDKGIEINSYAGAFSQIISNFVTNTLRYAFEPGEAGVIDVKIKKYKQDLILEYSDNGKGMEIEAARKIFDPFFTTGRTIGGTGLGMHIVYNLVTQKLLGSIKCVSSPGKGVHFTIEIPMFI